MTTITVEAEAIAALSIPAERLIQTFTDNGPEWHLLNAKRQVDGRLVEQMQECRALVAAADSLLPEAVHSQTFALGVTTRKCADCPGCGNTVRTGIPPSRRAGLS